MKRYTLALCLLFPVFLIASKRGGSPRKYLLPHGTTIEIGEQLVDMVDNGKAPESPVQEHNLGIFPADELFLDQESEPAPTENELPAPAVRTRRPISPADRSTNWRTDARREPSSRPFRCGRQIFVPGKPLSQADSSQNWRHDQNKLPKLVLIGTAVHCSKKTDYKKPNR